MNNHHWWLIRRSVEPALLPYRRLEELGQRISVKPTPCRERYEPLQTIPGIKAMTATGILGEIGANMSKFETAKALCDRSGICTGGTHQRLDLPV